MLKKTVAIAILFLSAFAVFAQEQKPYQATVDFVAKLQIATKIKKEVVFDSMKGSMVAIQGSVIEADSDFRGYFLALQPSPVDTAAPLDFQAVTFKVYGSKSALAKFDKGDVISFNGRLESYVEKNGMLYLVLALK